VEPQPEWRRRLAYLKHPQRLSLAEFEVALMLFEWLPESPPSPAADSSVESNKLSPPRFPVVAAWLPKQAPMLLRRIEPWLLNHYCYPLLRPFRRALAQSNLLRLPFCGLGRGFFRPRLIAFVVVGLLALHGAGDVADVFKAAADGEVGKRGAHAAILTILPLLTWILALVDVRRRNPGAAFSLSTRAWLRRGTLLAASMLSIGVLGSVVVAGLTQQIESIALLTGVWTALRGAGSEPAASQPQGAFASVDFGAAILARGAAYALCGAFAQWLWGRESAIENL
jgi:hypothetical protein